MAARQEKITVELSAKDRQLFRDIRDALLTMGVDEGGVEEAEDGVRRLVEDAHSGVQSKSVLKRLAVQSESPTEE